MAPISIICGGLLIILGLAGYFLPDKQSPTALIPAALGLALVILGVLAFQDRFRKHAMHAAAALALAGLIAALARLVPTLARGEYNPASSTALAVMAVICAVFVGLCVRSFVAARRSRAQRPPGE